MKNDTRETTKFNIGSNEFVVKTYLTGREARELSNTYLRDESTFDPEEVKAKSLNGLRFQTAQNEGWKMVIVSINGQVEGATDGFSVVDFVLDLPKAQYNEVVKKINEIVTPSEEKKTP